MFACIIDRECIVEQDYRQMAQLSYLDFVSLEKLRNHRRKSREESQRRLLSSLLQLIPRIESLSFQVILIILFVHDLNQLCFPLHIGRCRDDI